jgi:hypothetical protein
MKVTRAIVTTGTMMALAACGSGSASSMTAPASHAASAAASVSVTASVGAATAGKVCAAVNALAVKGDSGADAIATAASAYQLTQAQVVAAIGERCPELKKIIPAGA